MARIRELEQEVATKDFAINRMCFFLKLKDEDHSTTKWGENLQENYINYTIDNYDNDESYELEVRLNPDDVEHTMLAYFKDYKSEDINTISSLDSYLGRDGIRK